MKGKDLFIDFDDTLYDTHGNAVIALQEVFDAFHLSRYFSSIEAFTVPYWNTNIDLWRRYAKGEISRDYLMLHRFLDPLSLGEGLSPTHEYCMQVSDFFLDSCANKPGLVDGARDLMDTLLAEGYRMHMCSNGFHEVQYKKLRACGLANHFQSVILSEDAGVNKPHPDFFRYALQKTGADRTTTFMIGDNFDVDIVGAHGVGLPTIFFNRYSADFTPSSGIADHIVTHLSEVLSCLGDK